MKVRHDGGVVTRIGPEPRVSMREGCWRSVGRGAHRPAIDVQRVHRTHAMVQGLPGCFDQHAPRVVPALFGYPAALRRTVARLIDAWVQTEISDKLLRSFEANNRTDGCGQSECHHHIDTRDRHQALDILARQSGLSKFALYYPQVLTQAVVLAIRRCRSTASRSSSGRRWVVSQLLHGSRTDQRADTVAANECVGSIGLWSSSVGAGARSGCGDDLSAQGQRRGIRYPDLR